MKDSLESLGYYRRCFRILGAFKVVVEILRGIEKFQKTFVITIFFISIMY